MTLFTIGFTKKTAEQFFTTLCREGVKRIVDIRLNNNSQLAAFAKRDDLRFFLKSLCSIDYIHVPQLAPTQEVLDNFKKNKGSWSEYERKFLSLLKERTIEDTIADILQHQDCLLCSEPTPENCHRRLVAEYLNEKWGNFDIRHL
jgi:uncharacterized protein (DUF488 family)